MKLKNNGVELTREDVRNKAIPIENEEHFEYVTEVLKELSCKPWGYNYRYISNGYLGDTSAQVLIVDGYFDILRYSGEHLNGCPLLEIPLPSPQQTLPEKFKLSCGDKPEVRQWLKDLGYTWRTGEDLTLNYKEQAYMFYDPLWGGMVSYSESMYDNLPSCYTEITPVFSEREVTTTEPYVSGFEVVGSSDKAKVEELVEKLQKQLEEAKQELSKLKLEEK